MSRRDNKKQSNNKQQTKKTDNKSKDQKSKVKPQQKKEEKPKPVTAEELDEALMRYMGESAQKVHLDDELSSYFNKSVEESTDA